MLCGLSVGCNFPQQRLQTEVESTLVRSPGLYINPDGELSFQEDFAKETEIMTDFYRGIWEQAL